MKNPKILTMKNPKILMMKNPKKLLRKHQLTLLMSSITPLITDYIKINIHHQESHPVKVSMAKINKK